MKVDIYNLENKIVGEMELPEKIFGAKWKPDLVHQTIITQTANQRRPWAHAKDRSEVSGGGKKPWKQKGTGRARHGSTRSPIWIGGGKSHGPTKDRDYSKKINKKMRRIAIFSALSRKLKDKEVKIFDDLSIKEAKTRILAGHLRSLLEMKKGAKKYDLLLVTRTEEKNLPLAARNLTKVKVLSPDSLNTLDILNYKKVFIDQKAVETISNHYKA